MIILGIDPGSTRAGFAVIQYESRHTAPIIRTAGILKTLARDKNLLLPELFSATQRIIEQYHPDRAGIEKLYFVKNTKTALEVAQSRGVIICALTQKKIPLHEYTPLEIKLGMTGYGNADKKSIIRAVQQTIDASAYIHQPDDVFDAIAIALVTAYAHRRGL